MQQSKPLYLFLFFLDKCYEKWSLPPGLSLHMLVIEYLQQIVNILELWQPEVELNAHELSLVALLVPSKPLELFSPKTSGKTHKFDFLNHESDFWIAYFMHLFLVLFQPFLCSIWSSFQCFLFWYFYKLQSCA